MCSCNFGTRAVVAAEGGVCQRNRAFRNIKFNYSQGVERGSPESPPWGGMVSSSALTGMVGLHTNITMTNTMIMDIYEIVLLTNL